MNIVAISSTALILNELSTLALEITIWHVYMIISEVVTLGIYAFSMVFLPEYFVAVIVAMSALPLWIIKLIKGRIAPEATTKR